MTDPRGTARSVAGGASRNPDGPPRLVLPQDRLVGRDADRNALVDLLGRRRLVTIEGPAGSGTSRLAAEVARAGRPVWDGEVWPVDLTCAADPDLVVGTIASALRVEHGDGPAARWSALDQLTLAIGDRCLLLLLDGCGAVGRAGAVVIERLVQRCPNLRVLAAGRARLGAADEEVWALSPLGLPHLEASDPDLIASSDAVALYLDRVRVAQPSFSLDAATAPAVAHLCRLASGRPLAIRLLAARRSVSPAELVGALDCPEATAPDPLGLVLRWSYGELLPPDQALLRRLSVFRSGCTLASAEFVCSRNGLPEDQVLESLARLVAASLVVADTSGAEARYRLPEAVRALATGHLVASGDAGDAEEQHARWFTTVAEQAEGQLEGPGRRAWLARLDLEASDIRAALARSVERRDCSRSLCLAAALTLFWRGRGGVAEGRRWLEEALALEGGSSPSRRARGLWGAGYLAFLDGDEAGATTLLEECLELGRSIPDDHTCGRALLVLGELAGGGRAGDRRLALDRLGHSAEHAESAGDGWAFSRSRAASGALFARAAQPAEAGAAMEASAATARNVGDLPALAWALVRLGTLAHAGGDSWSAESHLDEAVRVAAAGGLAHEGAAALVALAAVALGGGDQQGARAQAVGGRGQAMRAGSAGVTVDALCLLGRLATARADRGEAERSFAEAAQLLEASGIRAPVAMSDIARLAPGARGEDRGRLMAEALRAAREVGGAHEVGVTELGHGNLLRAGGSVDEAAAAFGAALDMFEAAQEPRGSVDALEALAGAAVGSGHHAHAAIIFAAAAALREEHRFSRFAPDVPFLDADLAEVRAGLPADALEEAWAAGAALSLADAARLARAGPGETGSDEAWCRLTAAERSVIGLVAEGLTNRQIGERLGISRHTVQSHLRHVFAKLEIRSRAVLARQATARTQQPGRRAAAPGTRPDRPR